MRRQIALSGVGRSLIDLRLVQPLAQKNFSFVFSEIMFLSSLSRLDQGAYRDRHDTRGGDAMDAAFRSMFSHADERHGADGEIVWSWRPGAGAKVVMPVMSIAADGGNQAGPRGERV